MTSAGHRDADNLEDWGQGLRIRNRMKEVEIRYFCGRGRIALHTSPDVGGRRLQRSQETAVTTHDQGFASMISP